MLKRIVWLSLTFALLLSVTSVLAQDNIVVPYLLKTNVPITVDGDLSDWNFAFPIDFNHQSIPNSSRAYAWLPEDDVTLSGTLVMAYDDDYLYVGASVQDFYPGAPTAGWASDGIEIYMGNWDIGDSMKTVITGFPDDAAGHYGVQIGIYLNGTDPDSLIIVEYYQADGASIKSANTLGTFQVWPNEDGYDLEAQISWAEIDGYSANGNTLVPEPGTRVPCTWSLYSVDEGGAASFEGYQYSGINAEAPWMGANAWQAMDVIGVARGDAFDKTDVFDFVHPYLKMVDPNVTGPLGLVDRSITVDGDLSDWNFAFPVDLNRESIPDSSRAWAWIPASDEDLSGTIMLQYDEDYLYVGASVRDYYPGAPTAGWASDGVEVYLGNWDIGDSTATLMAGFPDDAAGHYAVQIGIYMNGTDPDSLIIVEYYQAGGASIKTANTMGTFQIWPDEDGYDLEAKISWAEIDAYSENGNTLKPDLGTRVPCTWSIFSVDEGGAASFQGYQYTCNPKAPWMGANAFQYVDVLGKSFSAALDTTDETAVDVYKTADNYQMVDNYPNPFNPSTMVRFNVASSGIVNLNIYNLNGQLVKSVLNNSYRTPGRYEMNVDMSALPSGVYVSVLEQGGKVNTSKMMLMK